jgi:hypothetical protein
VEFDEKTIYFQANIQPPRVVLWSRVLTGGDEKESQCHDRGDRYSRAESVLSAGHNIINALDAVVEESKYAIKVKKILKRLVVEGQDETKDFPNIFFLKNVISLELLKLLEDH